MKSLMFSGLLILLFASTVYSQNNACFGADPTNNIPDPKELALRLDDFTAVDPNNQPVSANYTLNVMDGTTTVSSVTIQKSSFTVQPGTPTNCYKFTLPS